MIPESFIEALKASFDIESIISPYAETKRAGRNSVCLCPFHSEKTPSCHIYTDSQSFYCFGCGKGGDAITFIRLIENLDYAEAVRFLAQRAGMTVPEDGMSSQEAARKPMFYEMNKEAARFWRDVLNSQQGEVGLDYLYRRGLTPNTIRKFGLGFAPAGWDSLKNHLRGKGCKDDDMVEASLLARSGKGSTYDFFRNRVMFPVIDRRGNVISFSGRTVDPDEQRKYINSSDTPVFSKRLNLFAVNFAKKAADKCIILCEGNMDVVSLNQAGFGNAVATLGTAITPEQARLIQAIKQEQVIIAYDSDEAGQKAAEKAARILGQAGITARVLEFPGDVKDPDDYIRKYGAEAFRALAAGSRSAVSFELSKIISAGSLNLDEPEGRAEYLKKAVIILAGIDNPVERTIYVSEVAKACQITAQSVEESVRYQRRGNSKRAAKDEKTRLVRGQISGRQCPEEGVLAYLLHSPDKLEMILQRVQTGDFTSDFNVKMLEILTNRLKNGMSTDISALQSEFSTNEVGKIEAVKHRYSDVPYTDERLMDFIKQIEAQRALKNRKSPADMTAEELIEYSAALKRRT